MLNYNTMYLEIEVGFVPCDLALINQYNPNLFRTTGFRHLLLLDITDGISPNDF